jgi:GGDEF domain-containing protein
LRLGACFESPFTGDGFVLRGSASIGIALYPEDATSALGLLRTADSAMYTAKYSRAGRAAVSHPDSEVMSDDPA